MSVAQVVRHGNFVVKFGERCIGIFSANVQNILSGVLNFFSIFIGRLRSDKIIVDDIFRVAVAGFKTPADSSEPSHVNGTCQNAEVIKRCIGNDEDQIAGEVVRIHKANRNVLAILGAD